MSKGLGLVTTADLDKAVSILIDKDTENPTSLESRLFGVNQEVFGNCLDGIAINDIVTLLRILLDGDATRTQPKANEDRINAIKGYCTEYKDHLPEAKIEALENHLEHISKKYDWLALKAIYHSSSINDPEDKNNNSNNGNLVDILTTIQKAAMDGISIPTKEIFPDEDDYTRYIYYCDRTRLEGAFRVYKLLIFKFFKHCLRLSLKKDEVERTKIFFFDVIKRFSDNNSLLSNDKPWKRENYLMPLGFLTYNWDPILPFMGMQACQSINKALLGESGSGKADRIYMDFGYSIPGVKLSGQFDGASIFLFGEETAFWVNSVTADSYDSAKSYDDVKSKFLVSALKAFSPHGLCNMRICPRCQNGLFIYPDDMGKIDFMKDIKNLYTSDPVPSLYDLEFVSQNIQKQVYNAYIKGLPDELKCPICNSTVYFEHSFMEIQSILKQDKPWSMSKIYFDYGVFFQETKHFISLGYSFPSDDMINSVYLSAMRIDPETGKTDKDLCATLVDHSTDPVLLKKTWHPASIVNEYNGFPTDKREKLLTTLRNVTRMVSEENIRISFHAFPGILDITTLDDLLEWTRPI